MTITKIAEKSKQAAIQLAAVSGAAKNNALGKIRRVLAEKTDSILQANRQDLENAEKEKLEAPLMKRLNFDDAKITESCDGIKSLMTLEDPVGKTLSATLLDKGLELYKVSRPIGVIGVVFESRPDALVQIACLCLKSGNAVLLKGGSEAAHTNAVLADLIHDAGTEAGLPEGWLALLESREEVEQMLALDRYIDLIIPRGSNRFVQYIMKHTIIPVLGHADGICHVYVDKKANLEMAKGICIDSKCQYVAVCNAAETFLIHQDIAAAFLPVLARSLKEKFVTILGCEETLKLIDARPASEKDWSTEYLDYTVSIKVVKNLDDAIGHINHYGSGHTDVIITRDKERAVRFMDLADTADAFWNCSSRFSDGFRFGLGAEVGISTNKIHARGPVGLEGLMSYQWRLVGNGHRVADFSGDGARPFLHSKLTKEFK